MNLRISLEHALEVSTDTDPIMIQAQKAYALLSDADKKNLSDCFRILMKYKNMGSKSTIELLLKLGVQLYKEKCHAGYISGQPANSPQPQS